MSLILVKLFVIGGGLAFPTGSGESTTTVISLNGSSVSSTGGPNVDYSGVPSIFVSAQGPNGTSIQGVYTVLVHNGTALASAYTPVLFRVPSGVGYDVIVSDTKGVYFNHWANGFSSRVIPVVSGSTGLSLKAVFTNTPQSPPSTPYSITVNSSNLSGAALSGILVDLRVDGYPIQSGFTPMTFKNLEPGLQYQVVVYWFGDNYFRHFSDGNLNRYELVTFNSSGSQSFSMDALYEHVQPSQAAALDIIAKFANGTVIGTTVNASTYIQHSPGVWTTVTPAGASAPFTGSDTGGSLLPFVLVAGQSYTVQMASYGHYQFQKWEDTGVTNPSRSLTLNGNTTLVAIYS